MTDHPPTLRRALPVTGREGRQVTVVVTVHRGRVWLEVTPPFESDIAILSASLVEEFIEIMIWAGNQARGQAATRKVTRRKEHDGGERNTKRQ